MSTSVGIGFSQEGAVTLAARDSALQAKAHLKEKTVDFAIVFATSRYSSPEALNMIRQTFAGPKIVGCSTAAVFFSDSIMTSGIAVIAVHCEGMRMAIESAENLDSADLRVAGAELAKNLSANFGKHQRAFLLAFFDGFLRDPPPLLTGFQEIFGKAFPILAIGSGDHFRFQESSQFFQEKALKDSVSALLIGGQATIAVGTRQGWKPLGKPRIATETQGSAVKTIDHQKAVNFYEEFFGTHLRESDAHAKASAALMYPLGYFQEETHGYLLRNIVTTLDDGSIICHGPIPQNAEIHLMISNRDFLKQAALEAAREAQAALMGKEPKFIIVFDSLMRYKLLGQNIIDEIRIVRDVFSTTAPVIGVCSYGEIFTLKSLGLNCPSFLQNGSIVVLAVA